MNLPNLLTWFRIIIIPVFVLLFFTDFHYKIYHVPIKNLLMCMLFSIAGITDWFDGYLARKLKQSSSFGAFLDPVADKLIVSSALILIMADNSAWYIVLPTIVIISREITISALREWMAMLGARGVVAVSWIGKWKTTFQMGAIGCLLFKSSFFGLPIYKIGIAGLMIATILTLWSMIQYLHAAWKALKKMPAESMVQY